VRAPGLRRKVTRPAPARGHECATVPRMPDLRSPLVAAGAINAALAIAAGAFGAHSLRTRLDARRLEIFETAARYQMYHALALVLCGILVGRGLAAAGTAGWVLQAGVVIFSGTLYALALSDVRWLGAITPIGGVAMIVGWILLAVAALRG
jgi:uncharacterized membrane protein YgdD (TMEM256/DUF423 family)